MLLLLLVVDDAMLLVLAALFVELFVELLFVELLVLVLVIGFSLFDAVGLLVVLFDMLNSLKKRSLFLFSVLVAIRLAVRLFLLPADGEPPFEWFS